MGAPILLRGWLSSLKRSCNKDSAVFPQERCTHLQLPATHPLLQDGRHPVVSICILLADHEAGHRPKSTSAILSYVTWFPGVFAHSLIHPIITDYVPYYVPDTVLGAGEAAINKKKKFCPQQGTESVKTQHIRRW